MSVSHHLVIVGGGASGALLAMHLCNADVSGKWTITLADQRNEFGAGLAYGKHNQPHHLLNVRAKQLSCFADKPDDFCNYLTEIGSPAGPDDFVARSLFGSYLQQRLREIALRSNNKLTFVPEEIVAAKKQEQGFTCQTASGSSIDCTHIVLACGNLLPATPAAASASILQHPAFEANPWNYSTFDGLDKDADVLLIGSGLTMADLVVELINRGHRGTIRSLSPHGFLPAQHQSVQPAWPGFGDQLIAASDLASQIQIFRQQLKAANQQGIGWTAVTDSLRPWLQQLWLHADDTWRTDFMQHVRHIWGVARHRLPPVTAAVLQRAIAQGQLFVEAGRIKEITVADNGLQVTWMPRGGNALKAMCAQKVINCTGPSSRWAETGPQLIQTLFAEKQLAYDRSALGVDALPTGQLRDASGQAHSNLFAVGPMMRGVLWEITAIPEIRTQVAALAERLLAIAK